MLDTLSLQGLVYNYTLLLLLLQDRASQIAAIETTFEAAKKPVRFFFLRILAAKCMQVMSHM